MLKWIIGLGALYLIVKNPSGAKAAASDTVQAAQKIATDITGSPTGPANNSPSVAAPAVNPDWAKAPAPPDMLYGQGPSASFNTGY